MAAVNCDEDSNRPFCSAMGVQGFPTLKIVKPSKNKAGKNSVEDYNGQRTAKAINDAVADKVPNHVQRLKDDALDKWLSSNPERPKAIFFSQKGLVPAMVKAVAIDFLGGIDFGFARDGDKAVVKQFGVESFPSVLLIPSGGGEAIKHTGEVKKDALVKFFSQIMPPHPDSGYVPEQKVKSAKKPAEKPSAASENLEDAGPPTESPDPDASPDAPKPNQVPVMPRAKIQDLDSEEALQKSCLHRGSGTCILAILSDGAGDETVLASLAEITIKHKKRGTKIFPFYSIPSSNVAGKALLNSLNSDTDATGNVQLLAINAKKAWWTSFNNKDFGIAVVERWIDDIRMGDAKKEKVPIELIKDFEENQETPIEQQPAQEEIHVEL